MSPKHNKAFKSDSQRLAVSLRSSIAKRRSHLNAALCDKGEAMNFTAEKKSLVYDSAVCLKRALVECKDPLANELLAGELGEILVSVIDGDAKYPITCIPHFDQMTRDWLPQIEDEYFNFYSFARYGKPAFK